MKLKALFVALSVTAMSPVYAGDWYIAGQIGSTQTEDADFEDSGFTGHFDLDNSINFGLALGKQINNNFRAELELSYREADLDKLTVDGIGSGSNGLGGEIKTTLLLANAYYDFTTNSAWSPYVSAGIGMAYQEGTLSATSGTTSVSASADDTVFAYQIGAGINYDVSDSTVLGLGYRYVSSSDPSLDSMDVEYAAHEVNLTLRQTF